MLTVKRPSASELKRRCTSLHSWEIPKQTGALAPAHVWTNKDMGTTTAFHSHLCATLRLLAANHRSQSACFIYLHADRIRPNALRTPELEQLEYNRLLGHRCVESDDMANGVCHPRRGSLMAGGYPHHVPREPRGSHPHRAQRRHWLEAAYPLLRDSDE
ncbi:hypothetical protein NPX13_g11419 [Xylaria arbuscula]|uniref:Uncharacterized protein n=1 Tax=Xylaria arbuscula TaxID=114810 RepID=A0A9W8TGZ0_9PEZI|nr:hypothetical protein NPX13_g11419 [Xylaria arbuscula]